MKRLADAWSAIEGGRLGRWGLGSVLERCRPVLASGQRADGYRPMGGAATGVYGGVATRDGAGDELVVWILSRFYRRTFLSLTTTLSSWGGRDLMMNFLCTLILDPEAFS